MRKRAKKKRHSCAACKPHKMGWTGNWGNRWKTKEYKEMQRFEKDSMEGWK